MFSLRLFVKTCFVVLHDVLLHDLSGQRRLPWPDLPSGVDQRLDAELDAIADDRAELLQAGLDKLIFYHALDHTAIMAVIGGDASRGYVRVIADDRIADVRKMRDIGAVADDAVLDLDAHADLAPIADGRRWPDVGVRADDAVLADDHRPFDIAAGPHQRVLADDDAVLERDILFHLAFDLRRRLAQQESVRLEQVPGVADGEPSFRLDAEELLLLDEVSHIIRDLILLAHGKFKLVVEDAPVQLIAADVREIRHALFRLLHERSRDAALCHIHAEPFRMAGLHHQRAIFHPQQLAEVLLEVEVIAVHDEELVAELVLRLREGVAGAERLVLFHAGDLELLVARPAERSDLVLRRSDEEDDFVDKAIELFKVMLQDGAVGHLEQWLRLGDGQRIGAC